MVTVEAPVSGRVMYYPFIDYLQMQCQGLGVSHPSYVYLDWKLL